MTLRARFGFSLLLLLAMLLGMVSNAHAGLFCSEPPFNGVVDGSVDYTATDPSFVFPTQITIDTDCTFQNFTASNPLTATLNFQTNDPSIYLITFDNVVYEGNMACSNIDHRIWLVNSDPNTFKNSCQDLFIPVEAINKQNPPGTTSVGVGEPFTYTLTIPVLYDPATGTYLNNFGSGNDLHTIDIVDDLNATGADLSVVGTPSVTWVGSGNPVTHTYTNNSGLLSFTIDPGTIIPAGDQIAIQIPVVADPTNTPGTQFVNTAEWTFGRLIDIDGVPTYFDPLPGEDGVTEPLTIAEPQLVVTKSSNETALNLDVPATFTVDVQNIGGSDAWNATIVDQLPDKSFAGMCELDPSLSVTAQIYEADGVTPVSGALTEGVDYTVTYVGAPTCELTLDMLTPAATIGPTERLIISYDTQLDTDTTASGELLTNVAGATRWYSADPAGSYPFITFTRTLSDGTPGITDHEDSYTITTALSGYYFQKTVTNLTTGDSPASTAAPGDTLRYRLRLFNVDQTINGINISDNLDPALFDTGSLSIVSLAAGSTYTWDPVAGQLEFFGNGGDLDIAQGEELIFEFEIDVATGLSNSTNVPNQADLTAVDENGDPLAFSSDDPYLNGIAVPGDTPDETIVTIQAPGPLEKVNQPDTDVTVGEQFTYTITVPATPVDTALYDVRILDDLSTSSADISFVSANVVSGGSWSLSNTGTSSSVIIGDTATGIDIPAGSQAVIEVTVEMLNTTTNQSGVLFSNTASYTYNRANGDSSTQTAGESATTGNMAVVEPDIASLTKTASNEIPTAGETIRYSVTLTASGGAGTSDVFDVTLTDNLDMGLAYAGNPTVTVGSGVSADNTIGAPDIAGDGTTTAQTLVWDLNSDVPSDIDIEAGTSVTIEYDVQVLDDVLANQVLDNSVVAQWTSLDGASASERTGSDGAGLLNDYITTPVTETVTTPDITATIDKARSSDTYGNTDADVRIGDIVEYTLTVSTPEGSLGNLQLTDTLPQGLDFVGVVSINGDTGPAPYTSVAPFTHDDILDTDIVESGDPASASTTVTWNIGTLTNQPDDGAGNDFTIIYQARVLNNVFDHADLSVGLNNTVSMIYDTATGSVTGSDTDTVITAQQPSLNVSKSATTANADSLVDPGELVTYTVDVTNNGNAPAYDVVVEDVVPVGLDATTLNTTGITLVNAGTTLTSLAPAYDAGTRTATWNFDTGTADAYTIPAGETLRIEYQFQADASLAEGQTLTNAATATLYYSFDDEAVPSVGAISGARETYGPSNTASVSLYSGSPPTKALLSPTESTIGEEIVYEITLPGTASSHDLYDVQITDSLDANLELVSASVSGVAGANDTSSASQMNITVPQIPAGQQAVIELHARVSNVLSAQQGVDINNTVSYTYALSSGGSTQPALDSSDLVTVNVTEPQINAITKTADNTSPTANEVVRYSVTLTTTAGGDYSDVFDVAITDTLDLGLVYEGNPSVTVGAGVSSDNSIGEPVISGDGVSTSQTLTWSLSDGNADIDIVEGNFITVSYDARVLDTVLAGETLTNSAVARWSGIDGGSSYERDGSDGAGGLNDYITSVATETLTTPTGATSVSKSRADDTWVSGDDNVRIGDIVEYELRLSLPEGTLGNIEVVDTLPRGLQYENIVSINGNTGPAPYPAVAPFSHDDILGSDIVASGDASAGPTTLSLNIGTVHNQPEDGLNNDFVIVYRARVLNNIFNHSDLSFPLLNTLSMTYDTASGTETQSANKTIAALQPQLSVAKTASPAGGDAVIDAGELITYTVDITNSGSSPAYDAVVQDILPLGLDATTLSTNSISLVTAGTTLTTLTPSYDPATRTAIWDFDSGSPNAYTIPAGETLRVVYEIQADTDLGAGLTLSNQATATDYYSFDDDAVPNLGDVSGAREHYGPSNTATTTLTSPVPGTLLKQNPSTTSVTIGESFSYRITVPATPHSTALYDVRILDDLSASAADLSFVSVSKVSGSQTWTPTNTGSSTNLVIEDTSNGIDIPAGEQIEIDITVVVDNTPTNIDGLTFNNTATYTYNQVNEDSATQLTGGGDTTADMTIVEPQLTLQKSGPAQMTPTIPGTFTLDVQNTGNSTAWDITITDVFPNPSPGGMCDIPPANLSLQVFEADGTTPISGVLSEGSDYVSNFTGAPGCTLSITMQSAVAAIAPTQRLIVTYEAELDTDNPQAISLSNVAGTTEWFSQDTTGSGASGETRAYNRTLTDGTTGVLDHEDAHTVTTQIPSIIFQKTVENVTSGVNPAATAEPGDTLRYTVTLTNNSPVDMTELVLRDELDRLNTSVPMFVAGSLTIVSVPSGADTSNTDVNGGTSGTGLLDVQNLSLDPQGGTNDSLTIVYEATLVPAITSGSQVLNQAQATLFGSMSFDSDDPNINGADDPAVNGDEDPTSVTISSSPAFEFWKGSQDLTDDPAVLEAGDTLRYTITVKNVGTEDAVDVALQDQIPANTSYVANTTTLNGNSVADPSAGVSALEAGMQVNAAENTTAGYMRADNTATTDNVATITFDVVVDSNAVDGAVISNQGFITGSGQGSGIFPEEPSDDPATSLIDDPTIDVLGSVPLVDSQKTVSIVVDNGDQGVVEPGDRLRYTITTTNFGTVPATGVILTDAIPTDTAYVSNTTFLNNEAVADPAANTSALEGGMDISSADLTPPLPTPGNGTLSPGQTATVTFDVDVNSGVPDSTIISNQGTVSSNELSDEPTDRDGIDSNGDQPTDVIVGNVQQLAITKDVNVVGGGSAEAGSELEYVVRITNISGVPATDVEVTDNLDLPVAGQLNYVAGSASMNGSSTGISFSDPVLSANYSGTYGNLPPGDTVLLRFRVRIDTTLTIGTTITNIADVSWNAASQTASASVSIDVGGTPGSASLSGQVWHDADFDSSNAGTEQLLSGWAVNLYRNGTLYASTQTDGNGQFQFTGVSPNDISGDSYELRFAAPGAGANTASLGLTDSPFTDGQQRISNIVVGSGSTSPGLNLPAQPNGMVYDAVLRTPVSGATLTMLRASDNLQLPASCFDDPAQQGQVTLANGYYKFALNFSQPECPAGDDYLIRVTAPGNGYTAAPSQLIPATTDGSTAAFDVPSCPGTASDAIPATASHCEAQTSAVPQPFDDTGSTAGTRYYLNLTLNNTLIPGHSELFNNHIPLDPELGAAVALSKVSSKVNVTRSDLVPYTITLNNTLPAPLAGLDVIDTFPAGFKYVSGSSRINDSKREPTVNGRQLTWSNLIVPANSSTTIKMLLIVGSGVGEGKYINRVQVFNNQTGDNVSGEARATVRVVADPTFDCSDIIGKVFDDKNQNGYQDDGEPGLPSARVATARGLLVTTDEHGRFHITCAIVPNQDRGSNFIVKLDERSLPSGYRVTTENPRVKRITRGKIAKFNFGASIHRVVRLDLADAVFEPETTKMRPQWIPRLDLLIEQLDKSASILRLSYLAENETEDLVEERLDAVRAMVEDRWQDHYKLRIETEVFWRTGGPDAGDEL